MFHLLVALLAVVLVMSAFLKAAEEEVLGQPPFQFQVVKGWARAAMEKTPLKNGHGLVFDKRGRLFVLTDEPRNNILILHADSGELLNFWTARIPGAYGLALVEKHGSEVLYITDTVLHIVRKLTLDGDELARLPWPKESGLYGKKAEYRPSKTLHHSDGSMWVLDGYGKDYVHHYTPSLNWLKSLGGNPRDVVL